MSADARRSGAELGCLREQQLVAMIESGHIDAGAARGALGELRDAHQRADNTLTLMKPRPEVGPE